MVVTHVYTYEFKHNWLEKSPEMFDWNYQNLGTRLSTSQSWKMNNMKNDNVNTL